MSKTKRPLTTTTLTASSNRQIRRFVEPAVNIESFDEDDVIMTSAGFNGQHEFDPFASWED